MAAEASVCMSVGGRDTSENKHRSNDEVGDAAEEQEDKMRRSAPASEHNLENCVDGRALPLDLNGKNREEKNLNCGSSSIPVTNAQNVCEALV